MLATETRNACCADALTGPTVVVLLANVGSLLQEEPGAVQVAEGDGQMERCPTSGVQRL